MGTILNEKIKIKFKILGLCVFFCLFFGINSFAQQQTIYLANGEWPPYYGENLPFYGYDSHIVTKAFAIEGIKVEYTFVPWVRAFHMVENKDKNISGAVGGGSGPEFLAYSLVSNPTSSFEMVFFHRKDYKFDWNSFDDLRGLSIGLTRGYDYNDKIYKMIEKGQLKAQWVSEDEINFKKLLRGRINIFPNDNLVGMSQLKASFTKDEIKMITFHKKSTSKETLHLILIKNDENVKLMEKFNRGLEKLKENGSYHKIIEDAKQGIYSAK